jgi:hypothetical protein
MGCCGSSEDQKLLDNQHKNSYASRTSTVPSSSRSPTFRAFSHTQYRTLDEVQEGLRKAGLESSNLIMGLDYTKSNTWNGQHTFGGKNLHDITPNQMNPYQEVIYIIGSTLAAFDEDNLIPVFGFGDITTKDKGVFPFYPDGHYCHGFQEVLQRYTEITPKVLLSGPTSFAPVIREAINIVQRERSYHILVIIADGQIDNVRDTVTAIVDATAYPLSIVVVGVGDGPWDLMIQFDEQLPARKFDNFRFVAFSQTMARAENREITFSVEALQEIPDQYQAIKKLGYFG